MYLKVRFTPLSSLVKNPFLPNHDITSCEESIYPFMYGFDSSVQINWFELDNYGNLIRAGSGLKVPYGTGDSYPKGYIALTDQRGTNFWIVQINLLYDTSRASSCHYATYSDSSIYSACLISSENFISTLSFVHYFKLNY